MIRRILIAILAVTLAAAALPPAAFADDQQRQPVAADLPHVFTLSQPAHVLNLQKAVQGVVLEKPKSARQQSGSFLETGRGKATLAAALLAASVFICYRMVQGPTPTSANAH